jgi:diguanylate cyclase (GGDEF)-like protein
MALDFNTLCVVAIWVEAILGVLLPPWRSGAPVYESGWLTMLSLAALVFTVALPLIVRALVKAKSKNRHRVEARIDPLTGVANRHWFLTHGADLLRRSATRGGSNAVLVIDLDHFKSINERFGPAVGERVRERFAAVARKYVGEPDLVGRLGGEQFAAVLFDCGWDQAIGRARRLRDAFAAAASEIDGHQVAATLSIGLVLSSGLPHDLAGLLKIAARALDQARQRGRNRVEVADLDLGQQGPPLVPQHPADADHSGAEAASGEVVFMVDPGYGEKA